MEAQSLIVISIFKPVEDPRIDRNKLYPLEEILLVAFATTLSNGDSYADMHDFGLSKLDFFRTLLPFKNGIPSEDTFERVFSLLNPKQFEECFIEWINFIKKDGNGEIIAIDGKTLKRSGSRSIKPLHMVNAWACRNRLVLACKTTDEKSNEITAIPEVLKLLSLKNTTITLDAMGCQTKIAQQIIDGSGDFVISLKGNQGNLHDDVKSFFELEDPLKNDHIEIHQETTKDHGRIEIRTYGLCEKIKWLKQRNPNWNMINGIGFVTSRRIINDRETQETRYYICSFKRDVNKFAEAARLHWGVENNLHWLLDITYREDYSRVRDRNVATNLAILRRIAINKFEMEKTIKRSKRRKRLLAGWDESYLKTLLFT
ncbi:ISAs1-like element ISEc1 family transposase [soil metagenome]